MYNRISLLDIIKMEQERQKNVEKDGADTFTQLSGVTQVTYLVDNPNPYAIEVEKTKTVSIKLLDVMFDGQVCNLVYM